MQTDIRKWGNSATVVIPTEILHQSGINFGDAVDIVVA
jgi:antitoxin component of MazEF toxin-antitoxin module